VTAESGSGNTRLRAARQALGPDPSPGVQHPAVTVGPTSGPFAMFPRRPLSDPLPGSIAGDFITITATYRHRYWTVPPAQLHDAVTAHVKLGVLLRDARRPAHCMDDPPRRIMGTRHRRQRTGHAACPPDRATPTVDHWKRR
jgi:hypothetical protein